jgi:hypothetical protein
MRRFSRSCSTALPLRNVLPLRNLLRIGTALLLASCVTPIVPDLAATAPVLENFGTTAQKITTSKPEAQRLFDQGVLQAHAFNEHEAVRAFKAALAADLACAMCAWGVAWQLGLNINATERGDQIEMRRYAALAREHIARATPRERGLIEAMTARYAGLGVPVRVVPTLPSDICGVKSIKAPDPLDLAYLAHMRELARAFPDDADIVSLYAEAAMIATPGDWWDRKTGAAAGQIGAVTAHIERLLKSAPDHTGLNHYLIHAVDASPQPQRAEVAADRLGVLAPQSPHLRHMPAHIYARIARFGDAVRVNQSALESEVSLAELIKRQQFKVVKDWDGHNLHFLWFAALMDGRAGLALETARRAAKRSAEGKHVYAEYNRSLPLLTLLRLQRWADVLAEPAPAADAGRRFGTAVHAHARAVALARTGQLAQAREAGNVVENAVTILKRERNPSGDEKFALTVLDVLLTWQQAELALAVGDADAAQRAAQRGVDLEDAIEDREPPLLAAGSRNLLGNVMLEAKRWGGAEQAFRDDLADQPGSGWALRGLTQSLMRQGKSAEAATVKAQWEKAWSEADGILRKL